MYVCICKAVTEAELVQAVESGHSEPDALADVLRLNDPDNCGRCVRGIDRLMDLPCIRQALDATEPHPVPAPRPAV